MLKQPPPPQCKVETVEIVFVWRHKFLYLWHISPNNVEMVLVNLLKHKVACVLIYRIQYTYIYCAI
jgi:hypothetical protein